MAQGGADANLAREVVARVKDRAQSMAKQIAQSVGEPIDASKLKREEVVRLWNMTNPRADLAQVEQLLAQQHVAEALDMTHPWRNKLIGKGSPQQRVDRATQFARWASGQVDEGEEPMP